MSKLKPQSKFRMFSIAACAVPVIAVLMMFICSVVISAPVYLNTFDRVVGEKEISGFTPVTGRWRSESSTGADGERGVFRSRGSVIEQDCSGFFSAMLILLMMNESYRNFYERILTGKINLAWCDAMANFREGHITTGIKIADTGSEKTAGIAFFGKRNREFHAITVDMREGAMELVLVNGPDREIIARECLPGIDKDSWHRLRVVARGRTVHGYLDGSVFIKHDFDSVQTGRAGLVSFGDTEALFDDFTVSHFEIEKETDQKRISPRFPRMRILVP